MRALKLLILLQLGWAAAVVAADAPRISILAPAVLVVASAYIAVGIVRLRNPGWRETRWWRARPRLRSFVGGDLGAPSFQSRAGQQSLAAAMQLVFGVFLTVMGVFLLFAIAS